ncbi:MAG: hypothetical protein H6867_10030 [Rhodospirillales bacterium]|nr:hypothetical protein [Rhodospirillales bacterium]MCB9995878.1 hypothetical protein [Rhodospirillales bacterium]
MPFIFIVFLAFVTIFTAPAGAAENPCAAEDKICLMQELEKLTQGIDEKHWKDQTYREMAKLLATEKQTDKAITLIERIETPDTKAMTIRGIGMEAAKTDMTKEQFDDMFIKLRAEAEKIGHPPSYAIALTYIAMSQAFAGDDDGAMMTANDMKNDALRNKAHGESAEIQAERGDIDAAMASIAAIDSPAFRDKAHLTISKIFTSRKKYAEAQTAAMAIENTYQKAQAVLYILAKQITPEEVSLVE